MPRVTIWIKEDDYPKWLAISDRPKFIHDAIERHSRPVRVVPLIPEGEPWVQEQGEVLSGFCKHNAKIGLCKMGCKR